MADLNDADRLLALQATGLLDTPPDENFDRLTRLASRILRVPVSLISLVDADRQFFKSQIGLPAPYDTVRQPSPTAPVGSKNANASKWAGSALSESHEGACPCLASLLQCDSPGNQPPALLTRVSYSITPSPQLTLEPSQKFARDSCSMTPEYWNHARMRLAKSSRRFSTSQQCTIEFLEDIVIRVTL